MKDVMWTEKYRPKRVREVVGNEDAKLSFMKWLNEWAPGAKAALLCGPPGTGKSALVYAAANEFGFQVIEMNASDIRNEKEISRIMGPASSEGSLDKAFYGYKGVLLFLDEVDGIFGREDYGGVAALLDILEKTRLPMVLVANDPEKESVQSLARLCKTIKFYRIRLPILVALLKKICQLEGINAEEEALELIAEMSQGDLRSAINDLQSLSSKGSLKKGDVTRSIARDRPSKISETLRAIFSAKTVREAKNAVDRSELDHEAIHQAIHDNLPHQYSDPTALATAYDHLSRADIYFGRIKKTQEWHLLSYAIELMVSGIVLTHKNEEGRRFNFPPIKFIMQGRSRPFRFMMDELALKIGFRYHASKRIAKTDYIPFIKFISSRNSELGSEIFRQLDLGDESVFYLKS